VSRRFSTAQTSALAAMPDRGVRLVRVQHDAWCDYVVTGRCNCRPDIVTEPLTPEALRSVANGMQQWRRERLS